MAEVAGDKHDTLGRGRRGLGRPGYETGRQGEENARD